MNRSFNYHALCCCYVLLAFFTISNDVASANQDSGIGLLNSIANEENKQTTIYPNLINNYPEGNLIATLTPPPGGLVLLITSTANPFSNYYSEILTNEGLNLFSSIDISQVSSVTLANYDIVLLGEMSLTPTQVSILSNWVAGGGNLIAMRPDKQLASLLGLKDAASTISDAYLLIDSTKIPGNGLVNQTIQFHGNADNYTLNGASSLAQLYTNATTAIANPALTLNQVGTKVVKQRLLPMI